MATVTKNLGWASVVFEGESAPTNQKLFWYKTSENEYYRYNQTSMQWEVFGSGDQSTWKGVWETVTPYIIGEYVIENNDIYVCTTANTDATFTPANWDKVVDASAGGGTTIYKGVFDINTEYLANDAVSFESQVWQNVTPIPASSGLAFNPTQWLLIGATKTSSLNYDLVGDNADWNGGTAPTKQNLVNDQLAERAKSLEQLSTWKGVWETVTPYIIGEYVIENNDIYVCTTANTDATFTPANWTKVVDSSASDVVTIWKGTFDSGASYIIGDAVSYLSNSYQANTAISPAVFNPAQWDLIGATDSDKQDYSVAVSGDWNGDPTKSNTADDQLASRLRTVEGSLPVPTVVFEKEIYANTDNTVSVGVPFTGVGVITVAEKSNKVDSFTYETSTDGGDTWVDQADLTALNSFFTTASGAYSLVRVIMTFVALHIGEGTVILKYTKL